jgi:ABC-2 type transport system ATP-binding protein
VGLLGPNGSGKSTALRTVAGLLVPTVGNCRVVGVEAVSPAARAVTGYLPESPRFPERLTGAEVVHYYAGLSGLPAAQAPHRAGRVLARVGLAAAATRRVRYYTKGMMQRLGLAQALVHDPKILILDEPTSGVDPQGLADMLEIFRQLKLAGRTLLLSSHLLDQVGEICDRIAILAKGRVLFTGSPAELTERRNDREGFTTEPMSEACRQELAEWLRARGHSLQEAEDRPLRLDRAYLERLRDAGLEERGEP